jgi:hypothetical protein
MLWIECPTSAVMGAGLLWPLRMGPVGFVPRMITLSLIKCAMFFWGQNFTKFQFGKYDFDLYKAYFMGKMTQIC